MKGLELVGHLRDDRLGKRIGDHLHVLCRGPVLLRGTGRVLGALCVDDGLRRQHVFGRQLCDRVLREAGGARDEVDELGDVNVVRFWTALSCIALSFFATPVV